MTSTACLVTLDGLDSHESCANPEPFRALLPRARNGHYWVPAVDAFAKSHGIPIRYPLDNCTLEITVTGPQLRNLLWDAYAAGDPFLARADPHLTAAQRATRVYAEDF